MLKKLLLGAIAGGLVLFIWGAISWMALPWHEQTLEKFADEAQVAQTLLDNAHRDGIYLLPNPHRHDPSLSETQMKAAEMAAMQKMVKGPYVFLAFTKGGANPEDPIPYIGTFFTQIVIAGLITGLILFTKINGYAIKVMYVTVLGLLGGLMVYVPLWSWWKFSSSFTLLGMADLLISYFLAGLVIAAITRN